MGIRDFYSGDLEFFKIWEFGIFLKSGDFYLGDLLKCGESGFFEIWDSGFLNSGDFFPRDCGF